MALWDFLADWSSRDLRMIMKGKRRSADAAEDVGEMKTADEERATAAVLETELKARAERDQWLLRLWEL
jgi:hypothetical protein